MAHNPSVYGSMVNSKGQKILFVEHPLKGDEYPVIAVCHGIKKAGTTDFFDLDDMTADHGDYEPWFDESGKLNIG